MAIPGGNERWENWLQFTQSRLVPKFTPHGFKVRKCIISISQAVLVNHIPYPMISPTSSYPIHYLYYYIYFTLPLLQVIKTPAGVAEKLAKAVADGVADWDNLRSEGKIDVIYHPGRSMSLHIVLIDSTQL